MGWGTSQTGTCVPAPGTGKTGDYCTNHKYCKSASCSGHAKPPRHVGECIGKGTVELGSPCNGPSDCKSQTCDRGLQTSNTGLCVPRPGTGTQNAFCTNHKYCSSGFCTGHTRPPSYRGVCAGELGDSCKSDAECRSKHCASLMTWPTGTCGPDEPSVASYEDKTRIYIRNNTNQTLRLGRIRKVGGTIGFGAGRHFFAKSPPNREPRYPAGSDDLPLMDGDVKVVPPGELVQVLWFQRVGLPNGAEYEFELPVSIETTGSPKTFAMKQRVVGQLIGSALHFGLDESAWSSDTAWHERKWTIPVLVAKQPVSQQITLKYRGLRRPGFGGDVEYVFVGPDPAVKLSLPLRPGSAIATDAIFGLRHVDHNPYPRPKIMECSDYQGRGNTPLGIFCYGGHEGTDFSLRGGYQAMDAGGNYVLAAADGVVTSTKDGYPDRCGLDVGAITSVEKLLGLLEKPTCPGGTANEIRIDHGAGIETQYLHLKKGSVRVRQGERVRCGQVLGEIGSSGYSIWPHLHFDVIDNGAHVDPFKGNETHRSYWVSQSGRLPGSACARTR